MIDFIDGTGHIEADIALAVLITISALLTYIRLSFERHGLRFLWARLMMGFGLTLWAMRFWITIAADGDVIVAPISQIAIALFLSGYCAVQLLSLRRMRDWEVGSPVHCIVDDRYRCQREDRAQAAEDNRK